MNDRCFLCGGVISTLGDCIECGTCAICYPDKCSCVYEYEPDWEELEDIWLTEDDGIEEWEYEQNKWEDARMDYLGAIWGYPE